VAGFRAEWPTRTFEVVQGAKAVGEALVADVRTRVAAQLEQLRDRERLIDLCQQVDERTTPWRVALAVGSEPGGGGGVEIGGQSCE
jgi:hypothetical protein